MSTRWVHRAAFTFGLLLSGAPFITYYSCAQEIKISDSLASKADKLTVKRGFFPSKENIKCHFGDFSVSPTYNGWTIKAALSAREIRFNTLINDSSCQKLSFMVTDNKTGNSALVNAANNFNAAIMDEIEYLPDFPIKNDVLWAAPVDFAAFITVPGDTSETWTLLLLGIKGLRADGGFDAVLTQGTRKIYFRPTASDNKQLPSLGYEFFEGTHSLGALQYFGGVMGYLHYTGGFMNRYMDKYIFWLCRTQDEKMKLVLAAAMTAVLYKKTRDYYLWW